LWRQRFLDQRVAGLYDELRPGRPRSVADEQIAALLKRTLSRKPAGATHWSVRQAAHHSGISKSTVHRVFQAFAVQPHRSRSFKLSTDPFFIEKTRDIVGLYLNPPDHALVLCVDEKSQIQALSRSQPILPMQPGQAERRTHDYKRHGTTSLFAALDIATGSVIGKCWPRHRAIEFRKFLKQIDRAVRADLTVHLVLDNYATHKTKEIRTWFLRHPRYHLHFTPTHSSWLNQVERWFALLSQRQIKRGSHYSVRELESAILEFIEVHNEQPKPFVWTKSADAILNSIGRFASRTLAAHGTNNMQEISDSGD
jgi:transposase